jgi:hypothetical protein
MTRLVKSFIWKDVLNWYLSQQTIPFILYTAPESSIRLGLYHCDENRVKMVSCGPINFITYDHICTIFPKRKTIRFLGYRSFDAENSDLLIKRISDHKFSDICFEEKTNYQLAVYDSILGFLSCLEMNLEVKSRNTLVESVDD